jgi:hypothetical protein
MMVMVCPMIFLRQISRILTSEIEENPAEGSAKKSEGLGYTTNG